MKTRIFSNKTAVLSGGLLVAMMSVTFSDAQARQSVDIPPEQVLSLPTYNTIDRNHVNVATGAVTITQEDVGIGSGALSLTHTIGTHTSDFVNFETYSGPVDRFRGGLMKKHWRSRGNPGVYDDLYIAQYFDFEGSLDFEINGDGTFTPVYDKLSSLVFSNDMYTVTKANGTVVEIPGSLGAMQDNTYQGATMSYNRIVYPNGYTITVHRRRSGISAPVLSVTTNTGLQLKYHYTVGARPLPAELDKEIVWPGPNIPSDGLDWSDTVPSSVTAINRGYEYCSDTQACSLSQSWPVATYHWPAGMPKAAFVGRSVFSVVDAAGRTTEYHHNPIDIEAGAPAVTSSGTKFASRLEKIKFAHETTPSVSYTYDNVFDSSPIFQQFVFYRKNIGPATLASASNKGRGTTYKVGAAGTNYLNETGWQHTSAGHKAVERYATNTYWNVPVKVETWDKDITYETQSRPTSGNVAPVKNRIHRVDNKRGKGATEYEYDARGHLTKVWQISDTGGSLLTEAHYPVSCTNPKTCNKPTWTRDARGNQTHYVYHPLSGNIARITYPADEQGVIARTRFSYQQYTAWYKNSAGALEAAPSSVWLLSEEKTCRTGNTLPNNDGCETPGTEIVTTYHYGKQDGTVANNLWLKGMTVTADGESRTTCYGYDKLGNRISETAPKANHSICD